MEEIHVRCFYLFGRYPEVVTRSEGWNEDQLVNKELRLPVQLSLHCEFGTGSIAYGAAIRLSITSSILTT